MNERITGALIGLIVAVVGVSFWLVFTAAVPATSNALKGNGLLRTWPNARIRAELGEASQVTDCQQLGLPAGLTCRVWVDQSRLRILILATSH